MYAKPTHKGAVLSGAQPSRVTAVRSSACTNATETDICADTHAAHIHCHAIERLETHFALQIHIQIPATKTCDFEINRLEYSRQLYIYKSETRAILVALSRDTS
jgi:hypothetical protein